MSPASLEPKARFRFLHIPKTAGAVTNEAIVRCFPPEEVFWFGSPKDWVECRSDLSGYACIVGHAGFDSSSFVLGPGPITVATIFRDPVERFLSNYFFHRKFGPTMDLKDYLAEGDDAIRNLEYVLDHPKVPLYGTLNLQVVMMTKLSLLPRTVFAPPYVIPSLDAIDHVDVPLEQQTAVFDAAMDHLSQVDIVGTFEDLPKFYARVSEALGQPVEMPAHRYNASGKDELLPPSHPLYRQICQKVADLQVWDQKLYEAAVARSA